MKKYQVHDMDGEIGSFCFKAKNDTYARFFMEENYRGNFFIDEIKNKKGKK